MKLVRELMLARVFEYRSAVPPVDGTISRVEHEGICNSIHIGEPSIGARREAEKRNDEEPSRKKARRIGEDPFRFPLGLTPHSRSSRTPQVYCVTRDGFLFQRRRTSSCIRNTPSHRSTTCEIPRTPFSRLICSPRCGYEKEARGFRFLLLIAEALYPLRRRIFYLIFLHLFFLRNSLSAWQSFNFFFFLKRDL